MPMDQTLFQQEPGDTFPISINDVNQGSLGDCFLCASIAALALERPDLVQNMIRDNGNGTQSVRLYLNNSPFPTWITVQDANLGQGMNTNNGGQLIVNGTQEIWPQVIENAYAQVVGGYSSLNMGGLPWMAMPQLTGAPAYQTPLFAGPAYAPTTAQLQNYLVDKDLVTFDTFAPDGYSLVESHSYTLTSVDTENGVDYAHFRNPWGYDDPPPVPVSQLSKEFLQMDVGLTPTLMPTISTVTGIPYTGVRLAGTSEAGSQVRVTDTVRGQTTVVGTATTGANGSWSLTSVSGLGHIDLSTVHDYAVSTSDNAGRWGAGPGSLFLTDVRSDVLTATAGVSDVFAVMSNLGSEIINAFQPSSAGGPAHDVIDFSGRGLTSFSQVQALMSGSSSTVITLSGGKTITLTGISPSELSATDFRYS